MEKVKNIERYGIVKLNATNYSTWKHKMELLLTTEDLWETIGSPAPAIPNDTWMRKDNIARAILGLSISDKYLVDIKYEKSAIDIWKKLAKIHQRDNLGSRLLLYRKIFTAKYIRGSDLSDHISIMLETASQLEDMGYPVLQEMMCSAILGSLPPEYNPMITAIEGRHADDITVEYIREKIMEEGTRLHHISPETTRALSTNQHPRRRNITSQCYYCHKIGHLRRDCRILKQHESHQPMQGRKTNFNTNKYKKPIKEQTKITQVPEMGESYKNTSKAIHIDEDRKHNHKALAITTKDRSNNNHQWVIDTGAGTHMCYDISLLKEIKELTQPTSITTASGEEHEVRQAGTVNLSIRSENGDMGTIELKDVLLVESLTDNLMSVSQLDNEGYEIIFKNKTCKITQNGVTYRLGELRDNLYIWEKNEQNSLAAVCKHIWHQRLGHRNTERITKMAETTKPKGLHITPCSNDHICEICQITKKHQDKYEVQETRKPDRPFHTIHADLCGPVSPQSLGHNRYALSIVDDYSRFATVYLIHHKHQVTSRITEFIEMGINKFDKRPLVFRSDGGGEFQNKQLNNYLKSKGIQHQTSLPYAHQQNGLIERHNRTLMEGTRSLLKQAKLPHNLWAEMASTYTYLNNLITKGNNEQTPYELWNSEKPDYTHLRTIGSKCYFMNMTPNKKKLEDRGIEGILIGYGCSTGFYRIFNATNNKIHVSRTVSFPEDICPNPNEHFIIETKLPVPSEELSPDEKIVSKDPVAPITRKSTRSNKGQPPQKLTYNEDGKPLTEKPDW